MNHTAFKNMRIMFAPALALVLATLLALPGSETYAAKKKPVGVNIDSIADANKAHRLIDVSDMIMGKNPMIGAMMYDLAGELVQGDTMVMLATNDASLRVRRKNNPLYYRQLELLESVANPPERYYFDLITATAPDIDQDSLANFRTALKAHNRFKENLLFLGYLMQQGEDYLISKKYRQRENSQIVDTLKLSPDNIAFAEQLLAIADSAEQTTGYSITIDKARASFYTILERKNKLAELSKSLETRDSTDIEVLDLLTRLAYELGDSARVNELGLRRFYVQPEPEHIYSLYGAVSNDTLRQNIVEAVLKTSADTDLDPELRINLLRASALAFYQTHHNIEGSVQPLTAIDERVSDIISEDPSDMPMYIYGTSLVYTPHWLKNYGYRHWMSAVDNLPDSLTEISVLTSTILETLPGTPDVENHLKKVYDISKAKRPDLELINRLNMAHYYFYQKRFEECLALLKAVTIDDFKEMARLMGEYMETHPEEASQGKDIRKEYGDKDYLKHWIDVQTIISESQMQLDRVDDALATLNSIIAVDPENSMALNNLAYYMCENNKDLTVALSLVNRALDIAPDNLNALDTRAWIYYKQGKYQEALSEMEKFFTLINLSIFKDLFNKDDSRTIKELLEKKVSLNEIEPILGHLLLILGQADSSYAEDCELLAQCLEEINADNEELQYFNKYLRKNNENK